MTHITTTGRIHTLSNHVSSSTQYAPPAPIRTTRRALVFLAGFAVGVMLASILFVMTAEAQTVQVGTSEAQIDIGARKVTYTLHGEAVELPRDIVAAAQIPRSQYAMWDLDMLMTLADRQGVELTYMTTDDLVAMLDSVTALAQTRMAQIDNLRAALAEAQSAIAERDEARRQRDDAFAVRDQLADSLQTVRAELSSYQQAVDEALPRARAAAAILRGDQ